MDARKTVITVIAAIAAIASLSAQITSDVKDIQVAKQQLRIGTDTSKYFNSISTAISGSSTKRQAPTAKAVYDYGQTLVASGVTDGDKGDVVVSSSGTTWLLDQKGATTGQVLRWSGSAWIANGLNLYDMKTTGGTISAQYNEVWAEDTGTPYTLNLPSCNSTNDKVKIVIGKTSSDGSSSAITIDPAGSEEFSDGAAQKKIYSNGTGLSCTCRWTGSVGYWFFIIL